MTWTGEIGDVGTIVGAVTGSIALTNLAAALWRRGPGRRRTWIRNFRKLAVGVRPAFVEQFFGQPTFTRTHIAKRAEYDEKSDPLAAKANWVDQPLTLMVWPLATDGYLMALSKDDAVVVYSLTTASRKFRPRVWVGDPISGRSVRLGRSKFTDLAEHPPDKWFSWLGAHNFGYVEQHYYGNPGGYQTWHCGLSDCGYSKHKGKLFTGSSGGPPSSEVADFRAKTAINSVLIQEMGLLELQLQSCGPDSNLVRLLHRPGVLDKWRFWRIRKAIRNA